MQETVVDSYLVNHISNTQPICKNGLLLGKDLEVCDYGLFVSAFALRQGKAGLDA